MKSQFGPDRVTGIMGLQNNPLPTSTERGDSEYYTQLERLFKGTFFSHGEMNECHSF
jgi:hypothetical protein